MKYILLCIMLSASCFLSAQKIFEEQISKEDIKYFALSNFAGSIEVMETESSHIQVSATLMDKNLDSKIKLEYKKTDSFLMFYFRTPCTPPKSELNFDPEQPMNQRIFNNDCKWEPETDDIFSKVDFVIKVPKGIHVYVSTIMNGDINVSSVDANVWAHNVNGSVDLTRVSNVIEAKTVNGHINVTYSRPPTIGSAFATINGDITTIIPLDPDVNASFKSFQGDFFTDLENLTILPSREINKSNDNGFEFILGEKTKMQIGEGGPLLAFETFSGDAYLKTK